MKVFLECKPDETLAVTLGIPASAITHSHSKGRVAKGLAATRGGIGLVDEDCPINNPKSLRCFEEVSHHHEVRLKRDPGTGNRLVVVCPRLEPWLITTTRLAGLDIARFGLGTTTRDLDSHINHRLGSLQALLEELLTRRNARLLHLQQVLTPTRLP